MFNLSVSETRAKVKFWVKVVRPCSLGYIATYMVPMGNDLVCRLGFGSLFPFFLLAAQEVLHFPGLLLR
jgi:hypothetical protein